MMLTQLAFLALPIFVSAKDFAATCKAFKISMPNVKVISIDHVANGTNITNFNVNSAIMLRECD